MAMNQNELDAALLCEEEKWGEGDEGEVIEQESCENNNGIVNGGRYSKSRCSLFHPQFLLLEQDLFWEDEELVSLFSKEEQQQRHFIKQLEGRESRADEARHSSFSMARREAVSWLLKVNAHYGFTALTAILAVNYFDRFISSLHFQRDKPWMWQLVAVTCLSLAAKVEETQVMLLLDLQVEDAKFVFEAKAIQRMELLVLSTLQWKMHPVTPISFLDHIVRRLGLKTHLHFEFLKRCERLLLSALFDSRFIGYLPSVLATATMMRVIDHLDPHNAIEYQNQLLDVLKISKEKVKECYSVMMVEVSKEGYDCCGYNFNFNPHKRKHEESNPGSPSGVVDAYFSYDESSSNDSWTVGSSVSSSPEPLFKRTRSAEKEMKLASLNRLYVGIVGSPP